LVINIYIYIYILYIYIYIYKTPIKVLAGIISNNYGDPVNGLRMVGSSISDKRYTYIHDSEWPSEAADVHHIVVRKSGAKGFLVYLSALLILANGFHLFLVKV
jgi:hypothetical protein